MRSCTAVGEKAIGANGFFLFGALTLIMAILKLTVITDWSWWRVSLPVAIFIDPKTLTPLASPRCFQTIPGSPREHGRVS